jgi:hypothetical protein
MRHARVKIEGTGCYHVVSRIVDRTFRLDDGISNGVCFSIDVDLERCVVFR